MSSLNPKGEKVLINGEERHLLFDYNIIAEIQEKYGSSVIAVIRNALHMGSDAELNASVFLGLLQILLQGEKDRETFFNKKSALKTYSVRDLGYIVDKTNDKEIIDAILRAWGISLPDESDEDKADRLAEEELAAAEGRDPN